MAPTAAEKPREPEKNDIKKKKKNWSEIDEIFEMKKARRREGGDRVNKPKDSKVDKNSNKTKSSDGNDGKKKKKDKKRSREEEKSLGGGGSGGSTKRQRRTAGGLVIYSAEELGVGKAEAGGTPLCPFDCSCCF